MEKVIEISDLKKSFFLNQEYSNMMKRLFSKNKKEVKALNGISMSVERGCILALLGKNGAGKTTLIKTLSGILTPDEGDVRVLGYKPYKERYQYSYHIGVVLGQKSLLWFNIPVIESLRLYKSIYEIKEVDFQNKIRLFNDIFDIQDLLNVPVRKLSLGQRMKCEIVAALLHNPEVLFLDEPTIGLDVLAKQQIYGLLKRVNKEFHTTMLLTTHNISDVEHLCERVIMMDKGNIMYDGNKDSLLKLSSDKKIVITGQSEILEAQKKFFVKQNGNQYIFKCGKDDLKTLYGTFSSLPEGSDIEILGSDLEDIVAKIYKGEILL